MSKITKLQEAFILSLTFLTLTGCALTQKHQIETQIYDNEFTVDNFEKKLYDSFEFKEEQLIMPQKQISIKGKIDAKDFNYLKNVDYLILIDKPIKVQTNIPKPDEQGHYTLDTEKIELGEYTFVYAIHSQAGESFISPYLSKNGGCFILDTKNKSLIEIQGNMTNESYNYPYTIKKEYFIMEYDFAVEKGYIEDVKDYHFK